MHVDVLLASSFFFRRCQGKEGAVKLCWKLRFVQLHYYVVQVSLRSPQASRLLLAPVKSQATGNRQQVIGHTAFQPQGTLGILTCLPFCYTYSEKHGENISLILTANQSRLCLKVNRVGIATWKFYLMKNESLETSDSFVLGSSTRSDV